MELKGVVSKLDIVLYDILRLGTTTTAGTYNFFAQSFASVGKQRASLHQPNLIPENWKSFTINAMGMKLLSVLNVDDFLSLISNGYYTIKISDYEIKSGHLSEFFNVSVFGSSATLLDGFQVDNPSNLYVALMKPIVIEPLITFNFVVEITSDVSGARGSYIGLYLKGTLDRVIVG